MQSKFSPTLLVAASLLVARSSEAASNIISVLDLTPASAGSVTISSNGPLAVSWTIPSGQSFDNVTIQAPIAFQNLTGGSTSSSAFLTTQLGAGTTAVANQIAATGIFSAPTIVPNTPAPMFTLPFGSITLGPGTYFLSIFHVSGGTATWDFDAVQAVTSDVGATLNGFFYRAPSNDGTYAPASLFAPQIFGPGFFKVTGDRITSAVPDDGSTALLLLIALIGLVRLHFRIRGRYAR